MLGVRHIAVVARVLAGMFAGEDVAEARARIAQELVHERADGGAEDVSEDEGARQKVAADDADAHFDGSGSRYLYLATKSGFGRTHFHRTTSLVFHV